MCSVGEISAGSKEQMTETACNSYGPRQSKSTGFHHIGSLNVEVKLAPYSCQNRRAPMRVSVSFHIATLSSLG